MSNIKILENGNGNINLIASDVYADIRIIPDSVTQSPSQNNLIYLFDPLYYNGWYQQSSPAKTYLNNYFKKYSNYFVGKITVEGCEDPNGNGIYTRQFGGLTQFTNNNGYFISYYNVQPIQFGEGGWYIGNDGEMFLYWSPTLERGYWDINNAGGGAPISSYINYSDSIIPPTEYVYSAGKILNKNDDPNNLNKKVYFDKSNFVFAYEKYNDDTDIPIGNRNDTYGKFLSKEYGVKERKKSLLKLTSDISTFKLFAGEDQSRTFSCFIKLKGPVKHRSLATGSRIIREKKGIFLNTPEFSIGYRSPHYYRVGQTESYKFKFEPLSFVFSINDNVSNHSFMTDFKFEFNKFYHLAITVDIGAINPSNYDQAPVTIKVYINGEQQNIAYLNFNPLIRGNKSSSLVNRSKTKNQRTRASPIQPGFYKYDGTVYSNSNTQTIYSKLFANFSRKANKMYLGKSNLINDGTYYDDSATSVKRYLNNIDVGVIHLYNSALSNSNIQEIYNTFGKRYQ